MSKEKDLQVAYHLVFEGEHGEKVLRDLMAKGHVLEPTHVPGQPDETSFREGERRLALYILTRLGMDKPDNFKTIVEETFKNE
jgi:hypothetical protein